MPDEKGLYNLDEVSAYNFADCDTPEGFDPNATGFRDCPVGIHRMRVDRAASRVEQNHSWKLDGQLYILNQFRPLLRVAAGPHAGAAVMDFLPMPTPGLPMPKKLADRWANFIRSFGFDPQPGRLTPPDFTFEALASREADVDIRIQLDADRRPKTRDDGRPAVGVAFFGYTRPNGNSTASTPGGLPPSAPKTLPPPPLSAPPADIDL